MPNRFAKPAPELLAKYKGGDHPETRRASVKGRRESFVQEDHDQDQDQDIPLPQRVKAIQDRVDKRVAQYDEEDEQLARDASPQKQKQPWGRSGGSPPPRAAPGGSASAAESTFSSQFYAAARDVRFNLFSLLRALEREDRSKTQTLQSVGAAFTRLRTLGDQAALAAAEDGVAADGGNQTAEILDSAIDAERDLDIAEKTRVKLLQGLIKKLKAFGQGVAEHEAHDRELEAELGREAAEAEGAQLAAEAARDAAEAEMKRRAEAEEHALHDLDSAKAALASAQARADDAQRAAEAAKREAADLTRQMQLDDAKYKGLEAEFDAAKAEWEDGVGEYDVTIDNLEKQLAAAEAKLRVHEQASRTEGLDLMAAAKQESRDASDANARMKEIEELKERQEELLAEIAKVREQLQSKLQERDDLASKLRKAEKELKTAKQLSSAEAKQAAIAMAAEHEAAMADKDREIDELRKDMEAKLAALRAEHEAYLSNFKKEFAGEMTAEHERALAELRAQLDQAEEDAKKARKEAHDERTKLREQLKEAKDACAALERDLEVARAGASSESDELKMLRDQVAELRTECEKEREAREKTEAQLDEMKAAVQGAKGADEAQLVQLKTELEELNAKAAAAAAALQDKDAEMEALKSLLEAAQTQAEEAKAAGAALQAELQQVREDMSGADEESKLALAEARKSSASAEKELEALREQLAAANAAIEARGGDQAAAMKALQEQLAAQRRASQQLEAELEQKKQEAEAAAEAARLAAAASGDNAAVLKQHAEEIAALKAQHEAALKAQADELRAEYDAQCDQLIDDQRKLLEDRLRVEDEHEHDQLRLQQAAAENEAFRQQVAELQNLLFRVEAQLEKMNDARIIAAVNDTGETTTEGVGDDSGGDTGAKQQPKELTNQIPELLTAVNANRRKSLVMIQKPMSDWAANEGEGETASDGDGDSKSKRKTSVQIQKRVTVLEESNAALQARVQDASKESNSTNAQVRNQDLAGQAQVALEQELRQTQRTNEKLATAMQKMLQGATQRERTQQDQVEAMAGRLQALARLLDDLSEDRGDDVAAAKEALQAAVVHVGVLGDGLAQGKAEEQAASAAIIAAQSQQAQTEKTRSNNRATMAAIFQKRRSTEVPPGGLADAPTLDRPQALQQLQSEAADAGREARAADSAMVAAEAVAAEARAAVECADADAADSALQRAEAAEAALAEAKEAKSAAEARADRLQQQLQAMLQDEAPAARALSAPEAESAEKADENASPRALTPSIAANRKTVMFSATATSSRPPSTKAGGDSMPAPDVMVTSRMLATAQTDLEQTLQELDQAPDSEELLARRHQLEQDVMALQETMSQVGKGSTSVSAAMLAEVEKTLDFVDAKGTEETGTSSRRRNILLQQREILSERVATDGSWRDALYLDSGDVDLNINLSHWSPDEQLQIQAEQKSYLEQKLDEQFQTLNAEKDKFRLLVMEGRQMLVDERHKTVVEAGRAMKLEAELTEAQQAVQRLTDQIAGGDEHQQLLLAEGAAAATLGAAATASAQGMATALTGALDAALTSVQGKLSGTDEGSAAATACSALREACDDAAREHGNLQSGTKGEGGDEPGSLKSKAPLYTAGAAALERALSAVERTCAALGFAMNNAVEQAAAVAASSSAAPDPSVLDALAAAEAKAKAEEEARAALAAELAATKEAAEAGQAREAGQAAELQKRLNQATAALESKRADIDALDGKVATLLSENEEQHGAIADLQRQLAEAHEQAKRDAEEAALQAKKAAEAAAALSASGMVPVSQIEEKLEEIAQLEEKLESMNSTLARHQASIDDLLAKERALQEEKEALEREKAALGLKMKEVEEELAKKRMEPRLRVALEDVKRGVSRGLQKIETRMAEVRLQRERNFMNVIHGYSAVSKLSRVVFNGYEFKSIVQWAEETRARDARLKYSREVLRQRRERGRRQLPALAGRSYVKLGHQPPLPPADAATAATRDLTRSQHTRVYAEDMDGSEVLLADRPDWSGQLPGGRAEGEYSMQEALSSRGGEQRLSASRRHSRGLFAPKRSTPSPSMTGNALPVRIPPLVASASPAVAGSQIAGGRPTRATKGRVPPTTQKAGGRASAGSGPSPAVLLEVDAPARPLGAPAWRPKRLGGGAASVISPGTATVLHMT